jgi:hypothetical protein
VVNTLSCFHSLDKSWNLGCWVGCPAPTALVSAQRRGRGRRLFVPVIGGRGSCNGRVQGRDPGRATWPVSYTPPGFTRPAGHSCRSVFLTVCPGLKALMCTRDAWFSTILCPTGCQAHSGFAGRRETALCVSRTLLRYFPHAGKRGPQRQSRGR